jgi:tetratricopeptide (TPR) repeat protein
MPSPLISTLLDTLRQGDLTSVPRLINHSTLNDLTEMERQELEQTLVALGETAIDQDRDLERAIASLQLATQLQPEAARPWALLGHAWQRTAEESGEPSDLRCALECFREAQRRGELDTPQYASLGEALRHYGVEVGDVALIQEAREAYLKALQGAEAWEESQGSLWLGLARSSIVLFEITRQRSHQKEALKAFEEASKRDPFSPSLCLEWATALMAGQSDRLDSHRIERAVELGRRALDLAPESAVAHFHLARLQTMRGMALEDPTDFNRAQDQVNWLLKHHPNHPLAHQAAGTLAMARARYFEQTALLEQAIASFRRAAELDPSLLGPWSSLSSALFLLAGMTEQESLAAEAVHAAGHAQRLRPWSCRERTDLALALIRLGELSFAAAPLEQAIEILEGLLEERGSSNSEAQDWLYHLGCAYDFLGDTSGQDRHYLQAIECLQKLVTADPSRAHAKMNLAQAHLHLGEVSDDVEHLLKSIELFTELAKLEPDSALIWEEWGIALVTLSELMRDPVHENMHPLLQREAEEKLMEACALGSESAWFSLACLYALAQESQMAMQALQRCRQAEVCPTIKELTEHPWLVTLHGHPGFQQFLEEITDPGASN